MRTGIFWEEGRFSAVVSLPQKKQDMTALLKNVSSFVANTDKNNGLLYVIRVNKKPELMGQSVYN